MITSTELAERAGVTQSRVRQLCLAGKLPARKVGRDWLIAETDAAAWMESDTRARYGPRVYRERHVRRAAGAVAVPLPMEPEPEPEPEPSPSKRKRRKSVE
jgi:excisionase family DNA binding protein